MASVHRREGTTYWSCCFNVPDGRRIYQSTKATKRPEAMRIATEWEKADIKTHQGHLTGAPSMKVFSDVAEMATGEALTFYSTEEWLQTWLAGKTQSRAEKAALRYTATVKAFLEFLPNTRRTASIAALASRNVQDFRDTSFNNGKPSATANMKLKILRAALKVAKRQGILVHNVVDAVGTLSPDTMEKAVFTPEMVGKLVEVAHHKSATARSAKDRGIFNDWVGPILAAYFTGARQGDLVNLSCESVSLEKEVIEIVP